MPQFLESGEGVAVGNGVRASKTPQQKITSTNRIGAEPGDTEQRLETRQGAGREPRDLHGVLTMRIRRHVPKKGKREHREAKRRSAEKNKSKSMEK